MLVRSGLGMAAAALRPGARSRGGRPCGRLGRAPGEESAVSQAPRGALVGLACHNVKSVLLCVRLRRLRVRVRAAHRDPGRSAVARRSLRDLSLRHRSVAPIDRGAPRVGRPVIAVSVQRELGAEVEWFPARHGEKPDLTGCPSGARCSLGGAVREGGRTHRHPDDDGPQGRH